MASRKRSRKLPFGIETSRLIARRWLPSCLITPPLVVKSVMPGRATTGLRIVFPFVPSTSTSNWVERATGLPDVSRRKSGTRLGRAP